MGSAKDSLDPTQDRLSRALRVSAAAVRRYSDTESETDAIRVFERHESERLKREAKADAKLRAAKILSSFDCI